MQKMNAEDIKAGWSLADVDVQAAASDLKELASGLRKQMLAGPEREEFLRNMTQEEFGALLQHAMAKGPKAVYALEKVVEEAKGLIDAPVADG